MGRDGARTGAQVDSAAVLGYQPPRPPGQLLALYPGDIDPRRDVQPPATERQPAHDPSQRLASLPPKQPCLERWCVRCGRQHVVRFLLCRDAPGGAQTLDHGRDARKRGRHAGSLPRGVEEEKDRLTRPET